MKFTHNWLKEHLDTKAAPAEIAEKLTAIGLEVENFTDLSKKYAPFVIAQIKEVAKHPNADKLVVCTVDSGSETLQIVCGAANSRKNLKVVLAPVGALIPGGNFQIKKAKIREVESQGMLCSANELELGNDAEGIIELPAEAPVGKNYAEFAGLNDSLYEINITPNRADALGVYGIARDLAAAGTGKLKPLKSPNVKAQIASPIKVASDSYYIGRYFSGVANGKSYEAAANKLKAIGAEPISTLVDITNYLTFDLGRPLHIYDADKLKGNIHVRAAKKGEKLNALNNKSYQMAGGELVVADDSGIIALAGIIGNVETAVSAKTKNIFLEVAYFDPGKVAESGRRHQIDSDARYRFERGVDAEFMAKGAEIASGLIVELCGGQASELITSGKKPEWQRQIKFDFATLKTFGGVDLAKREAEKILDNLGFVIKGNKIIPPSWRADISVSADIIEEILRIYGYDKIPPQVMPFKSAAQPAAQVERENAARKVLAARGLVEIVTYSFIKPEIAAKFAGGKNELRLENPISVELSVMRPSIIPSLLEAAAKNAKRGFKDIGLFEIGPVFAGVEQTISAGIRSGKNSPRNIYGKERDIDLFDAKADLLAVLAAANAPQGQVLPAAPAYYHPGKSGGIYLGKNCLGHFGEIHPKLLKDMDVAGPVAGFEAYLDNIPAYKAKYKPLKISDFQPVVRDFAFVLDYEFKSDELSAALKKTNDLIENVEIFDVYSGDKVEKGKKSIALSLTLQPTERTMTDAEIEAIVNKVIALATEKFKAQLRK